MKISQVLGYCAVCAVIFTAASAQTKPAAPKVPAAANVLKRIPAGSMGFVVINNVKASTDALDTIMQETGLAAVLADEMPEGTLKAIIKAIPLGEGFNPNGGVAVAMLDPAKFGINLPKLIIDKAKGTKSARPATTASAKAAPATQPKDIKLPLLIILPGKDISKVLGKRYNVTKGKPCTTVALPPGPMSAAQVGDYIVLSPNPAAIKAVVGVKKSAADELTPQQAKQLASAHIGCFINMKITGPFVNKLIRGMELLVEAHKEGLIGDSGIPTDLMDILVVMKPAMPQFRATIAQMNALIITGRVAKTGVVFNAATDWDPASEFGKILAAAKPNKAKPLAGLPNMGYVMAFGSSAPIRKEKVQTQVKMIQALLDKADKKTLPAEFRPRITKLTTEITGQITNMKMAFGGVAPNASGVMSIGIMLKCKDATKLKGLLAQATQLVDEIIQKNVKNPGDKRVKLTYKAKALTVEKLSTDVIELKPPSEEPTGVAGHVMQTFMVMFGEDGINFRVTATDKKTIVATFGGGQDTLSAWIKSVKANKDTISTLQAAADAMKHMPRNPNVLMFFNASNYFEMMVNGMQLMGGGRGGAVPFQITCKTPIAFGAGHAGTTQHMALFVPKQLIEDIASIFLIMKGPGPGGGGPIPPPVPEGDDF